MAKKEFIKEIKMTKEEQEKIMKAVEELNDWIENNASGGETNFLEFCSIGGSCRVQFLDSDIWNSEEDLRDFDEDKNDWEPIKEYLKREVNKKIDNLVLQKFTE